MDESRVKITIPKLWTKIVNEKQARAAEHEGKKRKKKMKKQQQQQQKKKKKKKGDSVRPGKLLSAKNVSSIVSGVFRLKKSGKSQNCDPKGNNKKRSGKIWDIISGEVWKMFGIADDKLNKRLSKSKKRESLREYRKVPSRILIIGRRLKTNTRKKYKEHTEGEADQEDEALEELCKKRILMGGKCKPLNLSGTLQYDRNGILLPEVLP